MKNKKGIKNETMRVTNLSKFLSINIIKKKISIPPELGQNS